jgi:GT2 family glycosyltransferase
MITSHTNKQTNNNKLAVLITCHNRREKTLACLDALDQQKSDFDVYLVDDGSSDGTTTAVEKKYPQVNLLYGDGNLFWVGGMRLAFAEALKSNYDYYLWLNDDTFLESNALENLLNTHQLLQKRGYSDSIVVGTIQDPLTGEQSYGGKIRSKRLFSHAFDPVDPGKEPIECETITGNCVLIPNSVAATVGNLDSVFIHTLGDLDYGLRARKSGCSIWVAPGYVGYCSRNSVAGSWADTSLSLVKRLQKAIQVKGFPLRPWTIFVKRYSGTFWFIYWIFPYLRAVIGYRNLNRSASFRQENNVN